jgi:hypothetical protein
LPRVSGGPVGGGTIMKIVFKYIKTVDDLITRYIATVDNLFIYTLCRIYHNVAESFLKRASVGKGLQARDLRRSPDRP